MEGHLTALEPRRMLPPERAFWPLWPLALVLPWPELSPQPSRLTRDAHRGGAWNYEVGWRMT